jgi:hypothetical protein
MEQQRIFMSTQSPRMPLNRPAYKVVKGDEVEKFHSWKELTQECSGWNEVSEMLDAIYASDLGCGNVFSYMDRASWDYDHIEEALTECGYAVTRLE